MIYSKISLMQVEKRDLTALKDFINELKVHLSEHREVSIGLLDDRYEDALSDSSKYNFVIRAFKEAPSLLTIGFCSVQNIDWISRHGELFFVMQDGGPSVTLPNTENAKIAFKQLLEFCFNELNLQKVWMEVLEVTNIKDALAEFGFVADGVRRQAKFKRGRFVDATVFSLLSQEYQELA